MGEQLVFGIGKWKTEAWEGEIVDKKQVAMSGSEGYDTTYYYLHVKIPDGSVQKKSYLDQEFYGQFNIGDRIAKRSGEKKPAKASETAKKALCAGSFYCRSTEWGSKPV